MTPASYPEVGAGDQIQVLDKPDHALTVHDIVRIYNPDRAEAGRLLEVPQVSEGWRTWAEQQVQRRVLIPADQGWVRGQLKDWHPQTT